MLERKSVHSIKDVENILLGNVIENLKVFNKTKINFYGDKIKISERYKTFFTNGYVCPVCGLEASFFAKEKHVKDQSYHLNLYGKDKNGKEILFTKDHIIPKSLGGKNHYTNYQTMCTGCNCAKGSRVTEEEIRKGEFKNAKII